MIQSTPSRLFEALIVVSLGFFGAIAVVMVCLIAVIHFVLKKHGE